MADVEQVVSLDPALTGRVLQFANSAASASLVPVSTVRSAVVRLGVGAVLSFATASAAQKQLRRALPEYGLSEGALWEHSIAAALGAELLPSLASQPIPPEAFTAALLHDVGKIVLARFLDAATLEQLAAARGDGDRPSLSAELAILGVHHGQLGGLIAVEWKLPERLVRGIVYHHNPADGHDLICDAVHVADAIAKTVGVTATPPASSLGIEPDSLDRLGLTLDEIDRLVVRLGRRFHDVASRYAA